MGRLAKPKITRGPFIPRNWICTICWQDNTDGTEKLHWHNQLRGQQRWNSIEQLFLASVSPWEKSESLESPNSDQRREALLILELIPTDNPSSFFHPTILSLDSSDKLQLCSSSVGSILISAKMTTQDHWFQHYWCTLLISRNCNNHEFTQCD